MEVVLPLSPQDLFDSSWEVFYQRVDILHNI